LALRTQRIDPNRPGDVLDAPLAQVLAIARWISPAQRTRVDDVDEFRQHAVAGGLNDAAVMLADLSPLRTDSLPLVSKIYWPQNADDAIMDAP
jgi:hypothetical protein